MANDSCTYDLSDSSLGIFKSIEESQSSMAAYMESIGKKIGDMAAAVEKTGGDLVKQIVDGTEDATSAQTSELKKSQEKSIQATQDASEDTIDAINESQKKAEESSKAIADDASAETKKSMAEIKQVALDAGGGDKATALSEKADAAAEKTKAAMSDVTDALSLVVPSAKKFQTKYDDLRNQIAADKDKVKALFSKFMVFSDRTKEIEEEATKAAAPEESKSAALSEKMIETSEESKQISLDSKTGTDRVVELNETMVNNDEVSIQTAQSTQKNIETLNALNEKIATAQANSLAMLDKQADTSAKAFKFSKKSERRLRNREKIKLAFQNIKAKRDEKKAKKRQKMHMALLSSMDQSLEILTKRGLGGEAGDPKSLIERITGATEGIFGDALGSSIGTAIGPSLKVGIAKIGPAVMSGMGSAAAFLGPAVAVAATAALAGAAGVEIWRRLIAPEIEKFYDRKMADLEQETSERGEALTAQDLKAERAKETLSELAEAEGGIAKMMAVVAAGGKERDELLKRMNSEQTAALKTMVDATAERDRLTEEGIESGRKKAGVKLPRWLALGLGPGAAVINEIVGMDRTVVEGEKEFNEKIKKLRRLEAMRTQDIGHGMSRQLDKSIEQMNLEAELGFGAEEGFRDRKKKFLEFRRKKEKERKRRARGFDLSEVRRGLEESTSDKSREVLSAKRASQEREQRTELDTRALENTISRGNTELATAMKSGLDKVATATKNQKLKTEHFVPRESMAPISVPKPA